MRSVETLRKAAAELSGMGYFGTYQADGQDYYAIVKWSEHQKVQHPSKTNKMPDPQETIRKFSGESLESLTGDQIHSLPDPGPCTDPDPAGRRRGALDRVLEPATELPEVREVWDDYREILDQPNARLDLERAEVIFGRLRQGATREQLRTVFRNARQDGWLRRKHFPVVVMLRSQDQFEGLLAGGAGGGSGAGPDPDEVFGG